MTTISDEYMNQMLGQTKPYCIILLKAGPQSNHHDRKKIIWEHGRRNFSLRSEGLISIVCPVTENTGIAGLAISNRTKDETMKIMNDDPAVQAGILIYEVHPCRSFPGDSLP